MKNKRTMFFATILATSFLTSVAHSAVPVSEISLFSYIKILINSMEANTTQVVTSIKNDVKTKLNDLNTHLTNNVDLGAYPKPKSVISSSGTASSDEEKISDVLQGGIARAQQMFGNEGENMEADAISARKNVELFNMEKLLARMDKGTHTGKANKQAMIEKADLLYADLFLAIKTLKNIENNVEGMDKLKTSLDAAKNGDIFDVAYVNAAINLQNTIALNQLAETIALQTASTIRSNLASQNVELVKHYSVGNYSSSALQAAE